MKTIRIPFVTFIVGLLCVLAVACNGSSPSISSNTRVAIPTDQPSTTTNNPTPDSPVSIVTTIEGESQNNQTPGNAGDNSVVEIPGSIENIGTIEATVDGSQRTWYVIDGGSCLWGAVVGTQTVSVIGYENPAIVATEQINFNGNLYPRAWEQSYDLGISRFIIEFENNIPLVGSGLIDLLSQPRSGASKGDSIFMSYTNDDGDFIHGNSAIQGEYQENGDGSFTISGTFTTDFFAERSSSGLDTLPGVDDGRFSVQARFCQPYNTDTP